MPQLFDPQERELLLRDINHRVLNNLQIILSILHGTRLEGEKGSIGGAIERSEQRINMLCTIHHHVYSSEKLDKVEFDKITSKLLYDFIDMNPETLNCTLNLAPVHWNVTQSIPRLFACSELLTILNDFLQKSRYKNQIEISLDHNIEKNKIVFSINLVQIEMASPGFELVQVSEVSKAIIANGGADLQISSSQMSLYLNQ